MENKLDVLTKKIYDEGVEKARTEAEKIISQAKENAANVIAEAQRKAQEIEDQANSDAENLKKKAESELSLSARQAVTALKQEITSLISEKAASQIASAALQDKDFVQQLIISLLQKWDIATGNLNIELLLPAADKEKFKSYIKATYKSFLDKGLIVNIANVSEGFIIQPKDGGYRISFSEELFKEFFDQYLRKFTKELLYK